MDHVVIVRGGALGDFILGLPLIDSLRLAFPGVAITLVGPRPWLPLAWRSDGSVALVAIDDPAISAMYGGRLPPPTPSIASRASKLTSTDATSPAFDDENMGASSRTRSPGHLGSDREYPQAGTHLLASSDILPAIDAVSRHADLVLLLFGSKDADFDAAWRASGARRVLWHAPLPDPDGVEQAVGVALGALRSLGLPTDVRQPYVELDTASQEFAAAWLQGLPSSTTTFADGAEDPQNHRPFSTMTTANRAEVYHQPSAGSSPASGYLPRYPGPRSGEFPLAFSKARSGGYPLAGDDPALRGKQTSEHLGTSRDEREAGREGLTPLVAIHPGSGGRWKCWPVERYSRLASLLTQWLGARIVMVGGPADEEILRIFRERLGRVPTVEATEWPLRRLAALLSRCGLFIGNDSGVTHLAAAAGCPTLALFGPTDDRVWAPRGPHVAILRGVHAHAAPPDPLPTTWWRTRPEEADLTVDQVYDAGRRILAASYARSALENRRSEVQDAASYSSLVTDHPDP